MPKIKRFLASGEVAEFILPETCPEGKFEDESPFCLVNRKSWGALTPTNESPMHMPIRKVRYTYEDINKFDDLLVKGLQMCQKYYMKEKGMPDIPYNFLVGEGGMIFEGRSWEASPESAGTRGDCLDIAFIGNFEGEHNPPSFYQCDAALSLINWGIREQLVHPRYETIPILNIPEDKKTYIQKMYF